MVEFALIALPLFILLFGTIEIGFVYWANSELENATAHGARLVRTGQVQNAGTGQAALKSEICSQAVILVDCTTRLRLDVRSASTFAALSLPVPLDGTGALKSDGEFTFSPGARNEFFMVSAFYDWRPILRPDDYILRATTVGRNEPF